MPHPTSKLSRFFQTVVTLNYVLTSWSRKWAQVSNAFRDNAKEQSGESYWLLLLLYSHLHTKLLFLEGKNVTFLHTTSIGGGRQEGMSYLLATTHLRVGSVLEVEEVNWLFSSRTFHSIKRKSIFPLLPSTDVWLWTHTYTLKKDSF